MKKIKEHSHGKTYHLKYKICISGSADMSHCPEGTVEKVRELGGLIAKHGIVLVTGATTGVPYEAAKGAKEAGGMVIGFSPAASKASHVKTYHLPVDYHDVIVYTGFDYSGRNLLLTRAADAIITISGRMGTLNEFTIGFEDKKPQGVLTGTGGLAICFPSLSRNRIAARGTWHTIPIPRSFWKLSLRSWKMTKNKFIFTLCLKHLGKRKKWFLGGRLRGQRKFKKPRSF